MPEALLHYQAALDLNPTSLESKTNIELLTQQQSGQGQGDQSNQDQNKQDSKDNKDQKDKGDKPKDSKGDSDPKKDEPNKKAETIQPNKQKNKSKKKVVKGKFCGIENKEVLNIFFIYCNANDTLFALKNIQAIVTTLKVNTILKKSIPDGKKLFSATISIFFRFKLNINNGKK